MPDLTTLALFVLFFVVFGYGLYRTLLRPLDLLRRRQTKDMEVARIEGLVHRGDEIEAHVTISSTRDLGDPEVGLVCTELYDEENTDSDGHTQRTTVRVVAYETWTPLENMLGSQTVRLTVPAEAPFSYEGSALSFRWELIACGHRKLQLDAQAGTPLAVLP